MLWFCVWCCLLQKEEEQVPCLPLRFALGVVRGLLGGLDLCFGDLLHASGQLRGHLLDGDGEPGGHLVDHGGDLRYQLELGWELLQLLDVLLGEVVAVAAASVQVDGVLSLLVFLLQVSQTLEPLLEVLPQEEEGVAADAELVHLGPALDLVRRALHQGVLGDDERRVVRDVPAKLLQVGHAHALEGEPHDGRRRLELALELANDLLLLRLGQGARHVQTPPASDAPRMGRPGAGPSRLTASQKPSRRSRRALHGSSALRCCTNGL
mmetsp:Transcript_2239/g.5652  ORF Transcript_2239/g.5652 Transcript_2239/m.5652 type:complete len:266 (+) Transcript_2239:77-874(+)